MRTTINIQDALMEELLARSKAETKTQAVQVAITDYLKRKAAEDLIALSGRIDIDPDWEAEEERELNEYRDHS
jgi:hypothetical protein